MTLSTARVAGLIAVGLLALLGVLALSPSGPSSASGNSPADRIALLRQPASGLGTFAKGVIATEQFKRENNGIDIAQARRADLPTSELRVWAVANDTTGCLLFVPPGTLGPGGGCGPAAQVVDGLLTATHGVGDVVYAFGLVPDGVKTVEIRTSTGAEQAPVSDNVFVLKTESQPLEARFTVAGKAVARELHAP